MPSRRLLIMGLIAFAAAITGVFIGRIVSAPQRASHNELHALLHNGLELTSAQEAKIEQIEAKFAARRRVLENEMRASNIRLAQAIEAERGYGPRVTEAIDHTHDVMGTLQKETLQHLFAMRAILNDDQARMLDESVVQALTADAR